MEWLVHKERKQEAQTCQNQQKLAVCYKQGLVKGAKLCLNPYFFSWLKK